MSVARNLEEQAWKAAYRLLVETEEPSAETLRYTVLSFAGKIRPGHAAIGLIEAYRAWLRGERGPLSREELAPLLRQAQRIGIAPIAQI